MRMMMMLVIIIGSIVGCKGLPKVVAEDSDVLWAVHKGVEADLMIGVLMIQASVTALGQKFEDPSRPCSAAEIYNTAWRYLRMCDALQQATLEGLRQKERRLGCAKPRRQCG